MFVLLCDSSKSNKYISWDHLSNKDLQSFSNPAQEAHKHAKDSSLTLSVARGHTLDNWLTFEGMK